MFYPSLGGQRVMTRYRVPFYEQDRYFAEDMAMIQALVMSGKLSTLVNAFE